LSGSQVPTSSDAEIRRLAHRVLLLQTVVGLAVALVCLVFWGRNAFISALAGAFTGVIANLYMTLRALQPARTPQAALGRMYFGQLIKVVVSVALFVVAFRYLPHVVWPALLVAYLATLVVSWSVPFASLRRSGGKRTE
jgi:F0F1-type ATP synthase assembly protein I